MHAPSFKQQRIAQLEELLEIEYEKLSAFRTEMAVSASAPSRFELRQRLKRDLLPAIKNHEVEYARLLAEDANPALIPETEAQEALDQVLGGVQELEKSPAIPERAELKQLMAEIRQKLNEPGKTASAKLKIALPIIPAILSYDMELDAGSLLMNAWRRIKMLFGAKI